MQVDYCSSLSFSHNFDMGKTSNKRITADEKISVSRRNQNQLILMCNLKSTFVVQCFVFTLRVGRCGLKFPEGSKSLSHSIRGVQCFD